MATTLPTEKLLTAEEFFRRGDPNRRSELVRGKEVDMNVPGRRHGFLCLLIGSRLSRYLDGNDIGRACSNDVGVRTQHNPDTVRGADVAFISYAREPKGPVPDGYGSAPPELVFEVLSPSDRMADVLQKAAEYLAAGVTAVCVVDSNEKSVSVYRNSSPIVLLAGDSVLVLEDILPGFEFPLRELFKDV